MDIGYTLTQNMQVEYYNIYLMHIIFWYLSFS